ncbi:MAG: AsmA family protein, partial [Candidatus Thiodiazotropha sp.]
MGKVFKVFGWLFGMLLVLIVAAIILVPMFVDLNDHKERIILEVKKATGRDLVIGGDIGLSVFPSFALELNGLSLSNAQGFEAKNFAVVQHAQVKVNMIPLLFRQVLPADTVQIEGLTLNLAKSKQGVTNWDDMMGSAKAHEGEDLPVASAGGGDGMMTFTIGGVAIKDARIVWDDGSTGEHYEVADLNLETGEIAPGHAVDISFNVGLESRKPQLSGKLALTGKLTVDDEKSLIILNDLALETTVRGEGLPEDGVNGQLEAEIRYDQANDMLDVEDLVVLSDRLTLRGEVEGNALTTAPQLEGKLRLEKFSPREWMQTFALSIPETADPKVLDALEFSTDFKAGIDHAEFDNLSLKLDQTFIKGKFELISFAELAYLFDLKVDQINLDRYLPPAQNTPVPAKGGSRAGGGSEELFPVELLRQLRIDGKLLVDSLTVNQLHAEAVLLKIRGRDGKLTVDQEIGRFYDGLTKGTVSLDVTGKA